MSDGHERSYYEIALTNRQVLTAFVILLSCVVLAFVSGLWVGRQAAERSLEPTVVALQEGSDETYRFFDSAGKPPRPAPTPPPPEPEPPGARAAPTAATPRSSPSGGPEQPAPPLGSAVRPSATPAVVPPPAVAAPPPPPPAAQRQAPAGAPVRQPPTSPPPAEPTRPRTVDPPATSELSVIQVFSTPEEAQARAVLDRLLTGSFKAFLSPVQVDGRTMYRVRVGPFPERAEAEAEAKKLRERYKLDTWITH